MRPNCFARISLFSVLSLLLVLNSCELMDDVIDTDAGKLEGEWLCVEESEIYKASTITYNVYISLDADAENRVLIDNFYQLGDVGVKAVITGSSISIHRQTIEGGFEVAGNGTISSNYRRIEWNYTVDDGSSVEDHVESVYTKK